MAAELGFANEEDALTAVGRALGLEFVDLATARIDLSLLEDFPLKLIHRYGVFPIARQQGSLVVATADPFDLHAVEHAKTVVVVVERRQAHPLYKKTVTLTSRFMAHDEENSCRAGDLVVIEEHLDVERLSGRGAP